MIKTVLKGVGLLVVAIVIVVVGWKQFFFDEAALRQQINQQAADQGLQLEIGQPLSIALFPQLNVEVREAQLQGATPEPVEIALLRFSVELFPLLQQRLELTELTATVDGAQWRGDAILQPQGVGGTVRFNLQGDQLNLDRYLPRSAQGEAIDPVAGAAVGVVQLPLEPLRALDLEGQLSLGKLTIANATVTDIHTVLQAKEGIVTLGPSTASLYGGAYRGTMRADVRTDLPHITLEESLQGSQLQPLLSDVVDISSIHGTALLDGTLTAEGVVPEQLMKSMNGDAKLEVSGGKIVGFNLNRLIRQARAAIEGKALPADREPNETAVSDLKATLHIRDGQVVSDDLRAESGGMVLSGSGSVDLASRRIDYRLVAQVDEQLSADQQAIFGKLAGHSFPVEIGGMVDQPRVKVDLDEVLKRSLQKKLKQKFGEKLEQFMGQPQGSASSTEEQLKKNLGNILQKLF